MQPNFDQPADRLARLTMQVYFSRSSQWNSVSPRRGGVSLKTRRLRVSERLTYVEFLRWCFGFSSLDEAILLACVAYVDPIRLLRRSRQTLETSEYTGQGLYRRPCIRREQ